MPIGLTVSEEAHSARTKRLVESARYWLVAAMGAVGLNDADGAIEYTAKADETLRVLRKHLTGRDA